MLARREARSLRWRIPAAIALLIVPALLAPGASAQSAAPEFTLLGVSRDGDVVTFTLDAESPRYEVTVTLRDGAGALGLPDRKVGWLDAQSPKNVSFTLQREASEGTLVLWWRTNSGWEQYSVGAPIPSRSGSADPGAGDSRLVVTHAQWGSDGLGVTVKNVGDAAAADVLVSLEDASGRKIATPFYHAIDAIRPDGVRTVHFQADATWREVTVALDHGDASTKTPVVVGKAAGGTSTGPAQPNVTLSADLPFREVEVGRTIDYALRVANTGRVGLVRLVTTGLPDGYSARFFVGGSAVQSFFVDTNQSRPVTLSVTVPNNADEVDREVQFTVGAEVNGTLAASVPAGLTVRGVGRLEVVDGLDVSRVPAGGSATQSVTVRNTGSAPLFDVQLEVRRPYGWTFTFEPRRVDRLDPGESTTVAVTMRAPEVVGPGRYPADLTAKSGDVSSRAVTLSMEVPEVESQGDWSWLVFLVVIAGILGGAAWWKRRGMGP